MTRSIALRLSLLTSLGLLPFACSESGSSPEEGTAGSQSGRAGSRAQAGGAGAPGGAGEGGSAAAGEGGSAGVGGTRPRLTRGCTSPEPRADSGLVYCADQGYFTRPQAVACGDSAAQGGAGGEGPLPRAPRDVECESDVDCAPYDRGFCSSSLTGSTLNFLGGGGGWGPDFCLSGCATNDDCEAGRTCVCNGEDGGVCVPSNCHTDADCGEGALCASVDQGCGSLGFLCQTDADTCGASRDCEDGDFCAYGEPQEGVGVRECSDLQCGRPFLVLTSPRVAPVVATHAWKDHVAPDVTRLTSAERAALAAHWTKLGQMEHASIAAFARFQLQLLALGAPPELVRACNQALVDETAHTQLCFGLASAYAGRDIGPGPLDVSHSLDVSSLADIVDLVIAEGCFGETSAALEALEAADQASDPVIRDVYARIAQDEQRHAELAFHFVRWALQRGDQEVLERVQSALPRAPRVARDVAVPCLQALLRQPHAA